MINNRILVRLFSHSETKKDGIIVPESTNKPQAADGIAMAVGPECLDVKEGDSILIDRYSQDTGRLTLDGVPHFIVKEPNVLAILS